MPFILRLSKPLALASSIIAALIPYGSTILAESTGARAESNISSTKSISAFSVSGCITYQGFVLTSHYKYVESSQLPAAKQHELSHLIQHAQWRQLPPVIAAPPSRSSCPDDGSPHFIIKVTSQDKSHTVSINTAIVEPSKELTPFLDWFEKQAPVEGDPGDDGCRKLLAEQQLIVQRSAIETGERRAFVPSNWEDNYFGPINSLTTKAKESPLRKKKLRLGAAEIRIWEGFGRKALEGFILRQSRNGFSANVLRQKYDKQKGSILESEPITDRRHLSQLWDDLTKAGIFELPDSSQLKGENSVRDGVSYVVEYRRGAEYRTYMYANPNSQSWPEARRMENIMYSVHRAFPAHASPQ
jgi:hypothetical protein